MSGRVDGLLADALFRQGDNDRGAGAEVAFDAEGAVVHLDEGAAERQAEAGALVLAAEAGFDLGEGLQHARLVVLGHADAGLDHAEAGPYPGPGPAPGRPRRPRGREL